MQLRSRALAVPASEASSGPPAWLKALVGGCTGFSQHVDPFRIDLQDGEG